MNNFYPLDLLEAFDKKDWSLVLDLLCKNNIDFEEPIDNYGATFLHRAAQCISDCMRRMVLCYSSLPANANAINYSGATPLHTATLYNSESCTTLLRQKGDVNSSTNYGYMSLQYAAKNDCYKAFQTAMQD